MAERGLAFMQEMILFSQQRQHAEQAFNVARTVQVVSPAAYGRTAFRASPAQFGLDLSRNPAIVGKVVVGCPRDGCDRIVNDELGEVGTILMFERGGCLFQEKVRRAEDAGAVGVVISDSAEVSSAESSPYFAMSSEPNAGPVSIPSVFLFRKEADQLRALIEQSRSKSLFLLIGEKNLNPHYVFARYLHQPRIMPALAPSKRQPCEENSQIELNKSTLSETNAGVVTIYGTADGYTCVKASGSDKVACYDGDMNLVKFDDRPQLQFDRFCVDSDGIRSCQFQGDDGQNYISVETATDDFLTSTSQLDKSPKAKSCANLIPWNWKAKGEKRRFYRRTASKIVQRDRDSGLIRFNFDELPNPKRDFGNGEAAGPNIFKGVLIRLKRETNFGELGDKDRYKALVRKLLYAFWDSKDVELDADDKLQLLKLNTELKLKPQ